MIYRIRNILLVYVMLLISFIIQYTLFAKIPYISFAPNLMLLITFLFGYFRGINPGMLVGFFAGLMIDVFYSQVIGYNALVLLVVGLVSGILSRRFYSNNFYTPIAILMLGDLIYNVLYFLVWYVLHARFNLGHTLLYIILPEMCLTFVTGVLFIKPLSALINKIFKNKDEEEI